MSAGTRSGHVTSDATSWQDCATNIVGGEIPEYAQLQAQTREVATRRMMEQAQSMGADAVVMIRYTTSMIATGASEILAYGTAVKLN